MLRCMLDNVLWRRATERKYGFVGEALGMKLAIADEMSRDRLLLWIPPHEVPGLSSWRNGRRPLFILYLNSYTYALSVSLGPTS